MPLDTNKNTCFEAIINLTVKWKLLMCFGNECVSVLLIKVLNCLPVTCLKSLGTNNNRVVGKLLYI